MYKIFLGGILLVKLRLIISNNTLCSNHIRLFMREVNKIRQYSLCRISNKTRTDHVSVHIRFVRIQTGSTLVTPKSPEL